MITKDSLFLFSVVFFVSSHNIKKKYTTKILQSCTNNHIYGWQYIPTFNVTWQHVNLSGLSLVSNKFDLSSLLSSSLSLKERASFAEAPYV